MYFYLKFDLRFVLNNFHEPVGFPSRNCVSVCVSVCVQNNFTEMFSCRYIVQSTP